MVPAFLHTSRIIRYFVSPIERVVLTLVDVSNASLMFLDLLLCDCEPPTLS